MCRACISREVYFARERVSMIAFSEKEVPSRRQATHVPMPVAAATHGQTGFASAWSAQNRDEQWCVVFFVVIEGSGTFHLPHSQVTTCWLGFLFAELKPVAAGAL